MTMAYTETEPTVEILKEVKLLKSFTDGELKQLLLVGTSSSFEAHTNIVIEGELSWGIYFILSGTVGIFKTNKLTGDNHDIGELKTGSFFGELSLVDENPRSATVRALTNVDLFYISKDKFLEFIRSSPVITTKFYTNCVRTLVARLRELDDNYVISQYQLWQSALRKEVSAA
jgi:CRP-like cAMP-binding protein